MRNYKYGAREPYQNFQLVKEQINLAYEYQEKLVCIEHRRRRVIDLLYRRACPNEWAEKEAATAAVQAAIVTVRVQRSNGGLEPDREMKEARQISSLEKKALEKARERERVARKSWIAAKKRAKPRLQRRLMMCDVGKYTRSKKAYNEFGALGLYSSTREVVHESVELASKMAFKVGTLPKIPVRDGSGVIAVRLQGGGLSIKEATEARDTRFQLEVVDAATWQTAQDRSAFVSVERVRWTCSTCKHQWSGLQSGARCNHCGGQGEKVVISTGRPLCQPQSKPQPGSRKFKGERVSSLLAFAKIRVSSDEKKKPMWAAFPVVLHRPIPPDAKIKRVLMVIKRIGPRLEWNLLLTVDDGEVAMKPVTGCKTLAVNLGWRSFGLEDVGLRVAYAVGSDGYREDVRVPPQFISGMGHVRGLGGTRAKIFEQAKKAFKEWIENIAVPVWLDDGVKNIGYWRSPKKLACLLGMWKGGRFDGDESRRFAGDEQIFETLMRWKKQDMHLWRWETGERERLLRMRKDFYRVRAAKWAESYGRIKVTDMDLRVFAQKEAPEDRDNKGRDVRVNQRQAAPSEMRAAIKNGCSTRGTRIEEIKAVVVKDKGVVGMTQLCHVCKEPSYFEATTILVHKCKCGAEWDQDYNHCMNLLASGEVVGDQAEALAQSGIGEDAGTERRQGRWQKRLARKLAANTANLIEDKQVG